MADYPTILTVLDHLTSAGHPQHHAHRWLRYGRVTVNGRSVVDPHTPVSARAVVVVRGHGQVAE
jgi:RNA-binding protein YlmH